MDEQNNQNTVDTQGTQSQTNTVPVPEGATFGHPIAAPLDMNGNPLQAAQPSQPQAQPVAQTPKTVPVPQGATLGQPTSKEMSADEFKAQMAAKPSHQPNFGSRVGEVSGLPAIWDLVSQQAAAKTHKYMKAVEAFKSGDYKNAVLYATDAAQVISPDDPMAEVLKQIVTMPFTEAHEAVKSAKEMYKKAAEGNALGAIQEETRGLEHAFNAVPLVGPAVAGVAEPVAQDLGMGTPGNNFEGTGKVNIGALAGDIVGAAPLMLDSILKGAGIGSKAAKEGSMAAKIEKYNKIGKAAKGEEALAGQLSEDVKAAKNPLTNEPIKNALAEDALNQGGAEGKAATEAKAANGVVENGKITEGHVAAEDGSFAKAKAELGEGASTSDIAKRAQELKNAGKPRYTLNVPEGSEGVAPDRVDITNSVNKSIEDAQTKAYSPVLNEASTAPLKSDTAADVRSYLKTAEKQMHTEYENGINSIKDDLKGETIDHVGSNLQEAAKDALGIVAKPGESPAVAATRKAIPGDLDAKTTKAINFLAGDEIEPGVPMPSHTIDDLIQMRQNLREAAAKYEYGDPNARALRKVINEGIDPTIEDLAVKSGKNDITERYQNLRDVYREKRGQFDSPNFDKLMTEESGKQLNDVGKHLLSGNNSLAKIQELRKVIGDEAMDRVGISIWKNAVNDASGDVSKVIKWWDSLDKLGDGVKQQLFGKRYVDFSDRIQNVRPLIEEFDKLGKFKDADKLSVDTTKQMRKMFGDESVDKLAEQTYANWVKEAKGDPEALAKQWNKVPEDAKQALFGKLYGHYSFLAENAAKQAARFAGLDNIANITTELQKDTALHTVRRMRDILGDEKVNTLAQDWMESQIRKGIEGKRFDPKPVIDAIEKIPEQARAEFFKGDPKQFESVLKEVKNMHTKQMLMKVGIGMTGGAAITSHYGVLAALAGGAAGIGGALTGVKFLDWIATHPTSWKALGIPSTAIKTGARVGIKAGATSVIGGNAVRNVYAGTSGPLGTEK